MSTKAQKRQSQRYKEEIKSREEKMKNLSETEIYQIENYAVFQILYINDIAYNCCKFLEEELNKIPYKSKAVKTVYGALMKRWKAYREFIELTGIDMNMVANLFCEMDEYMDDKVQNLQSSIQFVLERENVQYANWVSKCEATFTICEYAEKVARNIIEKIRPLSKRISMLIPLIIAEPARVMSDMADMVQKIHVKVEIDLNTEEKVSVAFRQLHKAFTDPHNFKKAQINADDENMAEGRMTIM